MLFRSYVEENLSRPGGTVLRGLAPTVAGLLQSRLSEVTGNLLTLATIMARGEAGFPAEQLRKMAGRGITDIQGNFHNALF